MRKALFILGMLDDGDIDWMISAGNRKKVSKGTALIHEGREIDSMYVVVDGAFAVQVAALGGKEIAKLRAGEIVGEMSFVDSRPPSASVVAVENSSVLSIPRNALNKRLEHPAFAARFYRALAVFLANRLRNTVARLGYGKAGDDREAPDVGDEIGPTVLETLNVAGARLDWMLRRLRGES